MSVIELFCKVDDFCQTFQPAFESGLIASGTKHRTRERGLCMSEIMTILIAFHSSGYRTFKAFYIDHVLAHWQAEFPGLVSYSRFVEFTPGMLMPLSAYLQSCFGQCTGISMSTRRRWSYAVISAFHSTKCSKVWPRAVKRRWVGFMASNYI